MGSGGQGIDVDSGLRGRTLAEKLRENVQKAARTGGTACPTKEGKRRAVGGAGGAGAHADVEWVDVMQLAAIEDWA